MSKLRSALTGALFILAVVGGIMAHGAIDYYFPLTPKVERITLDPGGSIGAFYLNYAAERQAGTRYVIDGLCISACTLILGTIPDDRVCVTPYARMAFHSASQGEAFSAEGTRLAWHIYPEKVRAFLKDKFNWDGEGATAEHPDLMYLEGEDLLTIYQPCKENA